MPTNGYSSSGTSLYNGGYGAARAAPSWQQARQNLRDNPLGILGPDGEPFRKDAPMSGFHVPPVIQFSSLLSNGWRSYWHGKYDEAMKQCREDALAMRNDVHLMGLMQERKLAVASLRWHIEVDNERDPFQKAVQGILTRIVQNIPRLKRLMMYLLEGIWYGRYGSQLDWQWKGLSVPSLQTVGRDEMRKCLAVRNHTPVNGDKIGHHWDGTPYLMVNPAYSSRLQNAVIHPTTSGAMGLYLYGSWRWKYVIHSHEATDEDYFESDRAEAIHGIGVRSVLYWNWWMKQEWVGNVADWCERCGLGLRLWYYQGNNPASKKAVEEAARTQSDKVNLLIPKFSGASQEGVEFVDTQTGGADLLLRMIEHLEEQQERYIVGQSMSSGADNESGLGGTGRSKLAQSTKSKITEYDAGNLGETITNDILTPVKHWTIPEARDIVARFVFNVESVEPEKILNAAKTFIDMGGSVIENSMRSAIGFEAPQAGDKVLSSKTSAQPPGMPGQPGAPGGAPGQPGGNPLAGMQDKGVLPGEEDEDEEEQGDDGLFGGEKERFSRDAGGHEHKEKGAGGGQFTSGGVGGKADDAKPAKPKHGERATAAHGKYHDLMAQARKARIDAHGSVKADAQAALAKAGEHGAAIKETMGNVAWDSDNEEAFSDLDSLISDHDEEGSPGEQYQSLKGIEQQAKAALAVKQNVVSDEQQAKNDGYGTDISETAAKFRGHTDQADGARQQLLELIGKDKKNLDAHAKEFARLNTRLGELGNPCRLGKDKTGDIFVDNTGLMGAAMAENARLKASGSPYSLLAKAGRLSIVGDQPFSLGATEAGENKKRLQGIVASARAARKELKSYVQHRQEMKAIKANAPWEDEGEEGGPVRHSRDSVELSAADLAILDDEEDL